MEKTTKQKPSYDKVVTIAVYLDLDLNYLFLTQEEANRNHRIYTLNEKEDELLKRWRNLNSFDQGLFLGRLQNK